MYFFDNVNCICLFSELFFPRTWWPVRVVDVPNCEGCLCTFRVEQHLNLHTGNLGWRGVGERKRLSMSKQARKPRSYASSKLCPLNDLLNDLLTRVKCRATSVAKKGNLHLCCSVPRKIGPALIFLFVHILIKLYPLLLFLMCRDPYLFITITCQAKVC